MDQGLLVTKEILSMERGKSSFPVREMTYVLQKGKENTEMLEKAAQFIVNDPILLDSVRSLDSNRQQHRERAMEKIKHIVELDLVNKNPTLNNAIYTLMSIYDSAFIMRIAVHEMLFLPTIMYQADENQLKKWEPLMKDKRILGCFAMTELGNGSYIQNFETTATFDKSSQEFVIESPTVTSLKWWIGMAAETATHSVVFARLIIDKTDHGVHTFIVPLRDIQSGKTLKGVTIGDVGPKFGRHGVDNGWIKFEGIRIPRENMLMKWCQVSPDGEYTKPPIMQIAYGALLNGRVKMVQGSAMFSQVAVTIAMRYSSVRVHHKIEQVIDYRSHASRLLPILAESYAMTFAMHRLQEEHEKVVQEMSNFDLSSLADFHAVSSGLKAIATWFCSNSLDICRQCLGGHGYSALTKICGMYADFVVLIPGEGENMVMMQQTARYLINSMKKLEKGKSLSGTVKYLESSDKEPNPQLKNYQSFLLTENQLKLLKIASCKVISKVSSRLGREIAEFGNKVAWNNCSVELIEASKIHIWYILVVWFSEQIQRCQQTEVRQVLKRLCDLVSLNYLHQILHILYEERIISVLQGEFLKEAIRNVSKQIRPDSIPLVDSFNLPDFILGPLGAYDGNVYERYLNDAIEATPVSDGPTPYFDKLIKPVLTSKL